MARIKPKDSSQSAAPGRTLIVSLPSYVDSLDWSKVFEAVGSGGIELELGSGDGGFMLEWARRNPDTRFLALERLLGRLRKLDRKGLRAGLINLKLLRLEGGYFLKYLVPPRSVRAVHLYFPDPWPKRRHWKNRMVNREFAEAARKILETEGVVYLRTDNVDYHGQMIDVFGECNFFKKTATPAGLMEVKTDFERQFNEQGIKTLHAAYRRID